MSREYPSSEKTVLVDYGTDESAMVRYREEGTLRALALDNRGTIRFNEEGDQASLQ